MTLIIAEIANNHDGDLEKATALIDAAKDAGADAVKFQLHIAEAESMRDAPAPPYFKNERPYDFFKRTAFSYEQWKVIREYSKGLLFICSPFSIEAVDLLERIEVDAYKIASGEVTNIPLLRYIASKGKPIYLSTGMSNYVELDGIMRNFWENDLTIMQCTSEYPCPYEDVGLRLMADLKDRYKRPVGLSDHTPTIYIPMAAVALGATVIEKHFTIDSIGPDASVSLTPNKFKQMVEGIRAVELALTLVDKNKISKFQEMKEVFEKSITSTEDIPKDTVITSNMIALRKPGTGLKPKYYFKVLDRRVMRGIPKDTILLNEDIMW